MNTRTAPTRILVVDDDVRLRDLLSRYLAEQGFQVAKAQVRMPNGPIKLVGDSTVSVALHTDVVVDITVSVYGETA